MIGMNSLVEISLNRNQNFVYDYDGDFHDPTLMGYSKSSLGPKGFIKSGTAPLSYIELDKSDSSYSLSYYKDYYRAHQTPGLSNQGRQARNQPLSLSGREHKSFMIDRRGLMRNKHKALLKFIKGVM